MEWTHRPYRDEKDFLALLAFLSDCNAAAPTAGYIQPGDLSWWLRQNEILNPPDCVEIFEDDAGKILGFTFNNPLTWAAIQALPGTPGAVLDDMLRHVRGRAGDAELTVAAFDGDGPLMETLERQGFKRNGERMLQYEYHPADQGVPALPSLPAGFSFISIADHRELSAARVELHQAVWHPSRVTLTAYQHLRASPAYDPELDVALMGPDGQLVSYALGWFDPHARSGLMEPVGTHPEYRRSGLGHLTVQEVNRRLTERGSERTVIVSFEKNAASVRLYASVGFKVTGYVNDYVG
ncbi:GNAT family N-acetyltransferase [Deinococcus marmoris]|uniref:GNAT family N-acetyltransferase n=1 Tax=Deinococcus marmoris TaxID=249408 RepID=UPI0004974D48|nr:GNAT family N-acetyltransferase [Deinococcus marmoris]